MLRRNSPIKVHGVSPEAGKKVYCGKVRYLTYDCLEDKREKLSELFCVVYGICTQ